MKKKILSLFFVAVGYFSFAQTTIIDATVSTSPNGSFENGPNTFASNGWTEVNGTEYNKWVVNTGGVAGFSGSRCAYVSGNPAGTPPSTNYSSPGTTGATVHFYRDVTFPAAPQTQIDLSFRWVCNGEANRDFLRVYLVPTTTTITAGAFPATAGGELLTTLRGSSTWQTANITIPCSYAGTSMRLVFTWKNNKNTTGNPGGGIDAISLISSIPSGSCISSLGTGVTSVASLPYASGAGTTAGSVNDLTSANTYTCGSTNYFGGEDQVFIFTAPSSGNIDINLTSAGSYTGLMVYDNCPLSTTCAGAACVASAQSSTGNKTLTICATSGVTYYLVLDSWPAPNNNAYSNLTISAPYGTGSPVNDLPCNATQLDLDVNLPGNNACSGSTSEPGNASCWTTGTLNTVWYYVIPTSTSIKIRTTLGTLTNTQIAVYSGACGSLTQIAGACNNDGASCGTTSYANSDLTVTGLTAGTTYYIRVDGTSNLTGSFSILAIDGSSSYPPSQAQDCSVPSPVCASVITVGNPGYQANGNNCDFTGASTCLASGERGSAWFTIPILANGNLNFSIVPNDYTTAGSETDYDFAIWKISGAGATTCAGIAGGAVPVRCNYSGDGVTGLNSATTNTAPALYTSWYDFAYESQLPVLAGESYILVVSNFSNSTAGFTLNFTATAAGVINYTSPTTVTWSGGANTSTWTTTSNWGSCAIPTCSINAVVSPAASAQPIISANQTVKDLTINAGGTLTINAGITLTICGNLTNYGTLTMDPTATIQFTDPSAVHQITGNFIGVNKIGNLLINKTGGSVVLNNDIEIGGNFTTSNSTSVLNTNGNYIKLAGNFVNSDGNNTFSNTGTTGTLEFNGTSAQTYTAGSSQLDLNNVVMNHSSTGVTLLSNMNIKSSTGTLTLTNGKIITNAFEVNVANTATTSVSTGNTTSFVQGNLRRSLLSTGSYDFPVGHATPGYQRANVNFTAATSIGNLLARFDTWPSTPPIQGGTDCSATFNQEAEDNGYWTITANANPSTGTYNMTLYPLNATNTAGMSGWTIMKDPLISSSTWSLDGNCVGASTATQVMRNGMSGFSVFGAAQSLSPLPIELLSFTGKNSGKRNLLEWTTATEINNDFFTLERSKDGNNFETVAIIDGAGNSTHTINYSKYDETPYFGLTYYRLKQTDFNNEYSYSQMIALENGLDDIELSNVHPNPTTNDINFDFYSPIPGTIKVQVLDYLGRVLVEENMAISNGKTQLNAKIGELAKGIYSLKVIFDQTGYSSVNMIIKQ